MMNLSEWMGLSLLKDKGAHRLISRKVQFDIKIGFIIINIKDKGVTQAYKQISSIRYKTWVYCY